MSVKERLKQFISYKKLTAQQFEIEAGLANGYISNMRKGVGGVALERISNKFPELSQPWLLTGEGEMLKKPLQSSGQTEPLQNEFSGDLVNKLTNILEIQAQQVQMQSEQIKTQADQIKTLIEQNKKLIGQLEKQESESDSRPDEASDRIY